METNPTTPHQWLDALEGAVTNAERAIRARDWEALRIASADQSRLRHGFSNALADAGTLPPRERSVIDKRVARIMQVRADQLSRLIVYRDRVAEELKVVGRFRVAAKSMLREQSPPRRVVLLDTTR